MEQLIGALVLLVLMAAVGIGGRNEARVTRGAFRRLGLRLSENPSGHYIGEGRVAGRPVRVEVTDGGGFAPWRAIHLSMPIDEAPPASFRLFLAQRDRPAGPGEDSLWDASLACDAHSIRADEGALAGTFPRAYAEFVRRHEVTEVEVEDRRLGLRARAGMGMFGLAPGRAEEHLFTQIESLIELGSKFAWKHEHSHQLWAAVFRHQGPKTRGRAEALACLLTHHGASESADGVLQTIRNAPNVHDALRLADLLGGELLQTINPNALARCIEDAVGDTEAERALGKLVGFAPFPKVLCGPRLRWDARLAAASSAMKQRNWAVDAILPRLFRVEDEGQLIELLREIDQTQYERALQHLGSMSLGAESVQLDRVFAATTFGLTETARSTIATPALECCLHEILEREDPTACTDAIAALRNIGTMFSASSLERLAAKRVDLYGLAAAAKDALVVIKARDLAKPGSGAISLAGGADADGGLSLSDDDPE